MQLPIKHLCSTLILCSTFAGCSALGLLPNSKKIPVASDRNPVVEVICLWEAGEGIGTDGMPTRGFAGQILFFTANNKEPVKAQGDIRIYVFDDQGEAKDEEKPLHQFDFDSAAFQTFLHDTNLGGAYQLFIPYTRKGGHQATCSLRVRITQPNGQPIYSKMASVILPGTSEKIEQPTIQREKKPPQTIEQMSHQIKVHDLRDNAKSSTNTASTSDKLDRNAARKRLSQLAEDSTVSAPNQTPIAKKPAKPAADHPLFGE